MQANNANHFSSSFFSTSSCFTVRALGSICTTGHMSCPFVGEKKKRELKQILNNDRVILYVKIYLLHLLYNYFLCVVVLVLVVFFLAQHRRGSPFPFPPLMPKHSRQSTTWYDEVLDLPVLTLEPFRKGRRRSRSSTGIPLRQ